MPCPCWTFVAIRVSFVLLMDMTMERNVEEGITTSTHGKSLTKTVFAEITANHKQWFQRGEYTKPMAFDDWFFKGESTQNRWVLMGDFSKGGVHKTDGFWWVIFQRGEYTKPMGCDGWFFKGGGEYTKPVGCDGSWSVFLLLRKIDRPGHLFRQKR